MSAVLNACVIGWPARHSRSPMIHRYWLRSLDLPGDYRIEQVPPEALQAFLADLAERGYVGANVTVPHKEAAFALAAEADETARALGAANTLWLEGGRLAAANTDVAGFLANLDEGVPGWDGGLERALVLGAGGAARAVVFALLSRGVGRVDLVNRTPARADALAGAFGEKVVAAEWSALPVLLPEADLLVNTTSLGMEGAEPLDIDLASMKDEAIVSDIVYVPLVTDLIAAAAARGLRSVDGLGMLLHQAVPGFERWFGVRPKVTRELRRLIEADIAPSRSAGR